MSERWETGKRNLAAIDGQAGIAAVEGLGDIAPDLARHVIEFAFGEVYEGEGLSLREREIATVAALTALGTAHQQLVVHIQAALNVGLSREEVIAIITQMAVYAGFPAAINGVSAAREAFAAHDERAA